MKLRTSTQIVTLFTTTMLMLASATHSSASLTNGLCAYWPLDNITGCNNKTPDIWNGYDMQVVYGGGNSSGFFLTNFNFNMYLTNDAVRGNAIYVDNNNAAFNGGNGMALAFRSVNTNDLVPVNQSSPGSNTVSFWMKTNGTHPPDNNDQRVFTESDYIRTYASVFDISPDGATYEIFTRQNTPSPPMGFGNFTGGAHFTGTNVLADGTWHNVTIEMINDGTGTNSGNWVVFVDAVQDASLSVAKAPGIWKLDTVALFALERNGAAGFITNCLVDDFAEWNRNLDTNEIQDFMANGITNAVGGVSPLTINQFSSDLFSVVAGTPVTLTWQLSSDATAISIDGGVGDVLPISSCGVGSTNVTVNGTTTFHIIATRGLTSVTNSLTVQTISGVAPGWNYVGGYNENNVGPLLNQGNWQTLLSSPQTTGYTEAQVLQTVTGNHILGIAGATELSAGFFGSHGITLNSTNTLFFRFYVDGGIDTNDDVLGGIPDVDVNVGADDAALRDLVDFTGTPPLSGGSPNTLGSGPGPAVRIFRNANGVGGPIDLTANYNDGTGFINYYSYVASVDPNGLATNTVYNVWIDVYNPQNNPNLGGTNGAANYYSVTVQKGGDAGTIIPLFPYVMSDRTTNSNETLNEAFICANTTQGQSTNLFVRFDDFYLSSGSTNHGIPVPEGSFILGAPTAPAGINITSVSKSGNSVTLNWSASPAGSYSFSVWSSPSVAGGTWTSIASGITGNTFTDTTAAGSQNFYRVTSP